MPLLLDLRGDLVSVRYSPGSLHHAAQLQKRFAPLVREISSWSGQETTLLLYLLAREEWAEAGLRGSYGLPLRLGTRQLALAAWPDAETVQAWRRLLGGTLPLQAEDPLRGSPEEASSQACADLVAEAEAARGLLASVGVAGSHAWVDGVLAHVVVQSALERFAGPRLSEPRLFYRDLSRAAGGPGAHALSKLAGDLSPGERLWFEAQFFEGALLITSAEGKRAGKKIVKAARKRGGRVGAAELLGSYDRLAAWLEQSFAAGAPSPR